MVKKETTAVPPELTETGLLSECTTRRISLGLPHFKRSVPNVGITNGVPDSRIAMIAFIFRERVQELFQSRTAMGFSGRG